MKNGLQAGPFLQITKHSLSQKLTVHPATGIAQARTKDFLQAPSEIFILRQQAVHRGIAVKNFHSR